MFTPRNSERKPLTMQNYVKWYRKNAGREIRYYGGSLKGVQAVGDKIHVDFTELKNGLIGFESWGQAIADPDDDCNYAFRGTCIYGTDYRVVSLKPVKSKRKSTRKRKKKSSKKKKPARKTSSRRKKKKKTSCGRGWMYSKAKAKCVRAKKKKSSRRKKKSSGRKKKSCGRGWKYSKAKGKCVRATRKKKRR